MGGGSGDAAAALRLAAHAAGVDDPALLLAARRRGSAATSRRRSRPGRTLMTGAGEHVRPLGPPGQPRPRDPPVRARALDARRLPRVRPRSACSAAPAELAELEARGGELPVHNDLQDAARSLCPPIDEALAAVAATGADHVLVSGSGPTVFGLYADRGAGARRRRGGRRDRGRAGRRGLRGGERGVKWGWLLTAVALAAFLFARRRKLGKRRARRGRARDGRRGARRHRRDRPAEHREADRGRRDEARAAGRTCSSALLAFLETGAFVGLVAPGETAVLVGGLVAGQGQIDLLVLIAIVWTCAVAGDVTSYTLGRRLGRAWLLRHGERLKITEDRLHQVERFFEKRGGLTILIGRFIGLVRALAPFIAGTSKMPLRQFLPYDIIGAGAWATTFCVLGYVFWQSFDRLTQYVSRGLFAFGTVVAIGLALYFLVRLRQRPGAARARSARGCTSARTRRGCGWC